MRSNKSFVARPTLLRSTIFDKKENLKKVSVRCLCIIEKHNNHDVASTQFTKSYIPVYPP